MSPQSISPEQLKQALSQVVRGEVYTDAARRGMYATDASHYQVMPRCVVVPEDEADEAVRLMIGLNPTSLRFRPVRYDALQDHVARAHTLIDVVRWEYAPTVLIRETFDGPCFEYRARNCLDVYLNGTRLNRDFMPEVPLDMVYRVQVVTPTDGSVIYPAGAVLLYTEAWLR